MTLSQQVAFLQRGLTSLARTLVMRMPPVVINFGAGSGGVRADPVTCLLYYLAQRPESPDGERHLQRGLELKIFRAQPRKRIDSICARWGDARVKADAPGVGLDAFQLPVATLAKAFRAQLEMLPLSGIAPRSQKQHDDLLEASRRRLHISERTPSACVP
ncbi:unnamed protein product, partial [Prorocentrum cordatum]